MKTQSILKTALFAASFSAMALLGSAQAQVVNVDLNNAGGASGTYSGVGAAADTGTYWNGFDIPDSTGNSYSISSLKASNGVTTTGISLSINSTLIGSVDYSGNPSGVAPALLDDFAYGTDGGGSDQPLTFTIGGLTAGHTYNLFLYSQDAAYDLGGGVFTIGSTTLTALNDSTASTAFTNGVNYVEFTGLTADGSNNITGTLTATLDQDSYSVNYLNGLQLVDTTPAEVPEPSTYALMGLGALALVVISRRRCKA